MSTPQSPASARVNYLAEPPNGALPAFTGDMRATVLKHLAAAIAEQRAVTVMQVLHRDPTMALEQVAVKTAAGVTTQQDVALACLNQNLTAGYVFAVNHGYDPSKLLRPALVKMATQTRGAEADVAALLAMGADPAADAPTVDDPGVFAQALQIAYPPGSATRCPGLISMLLDAKANPVYPEAHTCPLSTIVLAGGWEEPETRREHVLMMTKLVKAGARVDQVSGSMRLRPVVLALGKKNGHALVALIGLNCSIDRDALPGKKDLYEIMDANKLEDFKPQVQEALMARQIAKARKEAAATAGSSAGGEPGPDGDKARSRRRLGSI